MTSPHKRHKYYITLEVAELVYDILVRDCQVYANEKREFVNWFYGCQGYHSLIHSGCGPYFPIKSDLAESMEFGCLPTKWIISLEYNENTTFNKTLIKEAQEKITFLFARNWTETIDR